MPLVFAFIILLVLLALSVHVAATLGILGLTLGQLFSRYPLYQAIGEITWDASTDFILLAIPLFVLLGEILLKSGIADKVYDALDSWLSWLPGGMLHANIGTCAMFSATSGSSVATAATISTVALPQARRYGYNESFFSGSIAAGGTLGILIPPSINLIVYGVLTNTSIPQLFMAGIVPGITLMIIFMLMILIACLIWPRLGSGSSTSLKRITWQHRFSSLRHFLPVLFIFFIIIGTIYAGYATPTESAALGVMGAVALAASYGKFRLKFFVEVIEGTMRTTAMIMLILIAAKFLNFILASVGLTRIFASFLQTLGLSPLGTLMVIIAVYIILGFFIETLSLMVITIPIVSPVVVGMGYDPVWFGILLILLIEMALITPPVGLNLYVVQGIRQRGSISEVMLGSLPFVVMIFLMIIVLIIYPDLTRILIS